MNQWKDKLKDKLKMWLCDEDGLPGKAAHFFARFLVDTKVEVDVRGFDVFETYCWCCCFWRGVLLGAAVGGLAAGLIGWLYA